MRLYVFYYGHNGDALTTRPLLRRLKELGHEVAIGCFANHVYLFKDLDVEIAVTPFDDAGGYTYDEVKQYHRDRGMFADKIVSAWCGTYPDLDKKYGHNWANVLATVLRQTQLSELYLVDPTLAVPMLFDWKDTKAAELLSFHGRDKLVYLENGPTRSGHCKYEFDVYGLAQKFPHLTFVCTGKLNWKKVDGVQTVFDCSHLDLLTLSQLSQRCIAIVGKGSGPFFATFTEANRTKPRCVVGYETKAPYKGPFWPYPGNATRYVDSTEELYQFLEAL